MVSANTIIELFNLLSPEEQEKCRNAIGAVAVPEKRKKKTKLRKEHATDNRVYAMIVQNRKIKVNPVDDNAPMGKQLP